MKKLSILLFSIVLSTGIWAQEIETTDELFEHFAAIECAKYDSKSDADLANYLDQLSEGNELTSSEWLSLETCAKDVQQELFDTQQRILSDYRIIARIKNRDYMQFIGSKKQGDSLTELIIFSSKDASIMRLKGKFIEAETLYLFMSLGQQLRKQ